jgi:hypothetical protein
LDRMSAVEPTAVDPFAFQKDRLDQRPAISGEKFSRP